MLARDSSTASARAAGASAGASASASAAVRVAYRHASCMLCGPCESLDVSHASHTLRQLSHGMRFAAQNYKCSQLALEAQFYAGSAKVQSTRAIASVETLASLAALKQKLKKKRHKLTRTRAASLFVAYVTLPVWLQSLLHAFLLQSKYKQ